MGSKKTKHALKQRVDSHPATFPSVWLLLIGLCLIATISIWRNFRLTNPAIAPTAIAKYDNWKKATDTSAIFYSKIFLARNKTFIYIPLKFEKETQVAWLSLDSSASAEPTIWLLAHPTLEKLNWSTINEKAVYLYQRQKKYNLMTDFLKNPPPANKIMIEKTIKNFPPYNKIEGKDLANSFDPAEIDYILTTYKRPLIKNGALYYDNIIDATPGNLNKNEKLTWIINVPSASKDQPYYIGEIHVDYR